MAAGNTSVPNEVKLIAKIGEGSFGEVFRAEWMGKPAAAKRIKKYYFDNDYNHRLKKSFVEKFKGECELLARVKHANIVQYYRVIAPPGELPLIIMELMDRNLASFIRESSTNPRVSFLDTVRIMLDVAKGLRHLHQESIVHRDLSSRNILLTRERRAKIADLGVAKVFESYLMVATASPGAAMYAAPETYAKTGYERKVAYTPQVDIFSYGAVLLEVIVGQLPVYLPEPYTEEGKVVSEDVRRSEDLYKMGPSHPLRKLVESCLQNEPDNRPTASGIVEQLKPHRGKVEGSKDSLARTPEDVVLVPPTDHFDYRFKVIVLGELGVGKSTIIHRFVKPNESFHSLPRLDRKSFTFDEYFEQLLVRGKWVHLHIVDSNGQERFHNLRDVVPQIYRRVKGAIVAFDLSCQVTFSEVGKWVNLVRSKRGRWIPIVLVGNKSDLSNVTQVESETANQFAKANDLFYMETSAKARTNIDEAFSVLIELLIQQHDEQPIHRIEEDEPSEEFSTIEIASGLVNRQDHENIFNERRPCTPLPSNSEDRFVAPAGTVGKFEQSQQSLMISVSSTCEPLLPAERNGTGKKCCSFI